MAISFSRLASTPPGNPSDGDLALSPQVLKAIKGLAKTLGGVTADEAVMRAVETESELHNAVVLRLSAEAKDGVEEISRRLGGVSTEEVMRRAIGTLLYLLRQQETGHRVLVQGRSGRKMKQLLIREEDEDAAGGYER